MKYSQNGWIQLHRRILNHWLWEDRPFSYGQAWIHLLLIARYTAECVTHNHQPVMLQRGQLVTSESILINDFGWKKSKVRTFLDKLQNNQMIDKQSDNKKTIITICNYDKFQPTIEALQTTIQTTEQPQNNKHYIKENNNLKISKKDADVTISDFIEIYNSICGDIFGFVNSQVIGNTTIEAIQLAITILENKDTDTTEYFNTCLIDKHLTGQKHDGFIPTFCYLLKPETIEATLMFNQLEMSILEFDKSFHDDPIATKIFESATDAIESQKSQLLKYIGVARDLNISNQEILEFFESPDLSFTAKLIYFSELIFR